MQFVGIVGVALFLLIAWAGSFNRSKVRMKPVMLLLILNFVLAYALLNTQVGETLIRGIATASDFIFEAADEGVAFVFGGITNEGVPSQFFIDVLLPIIFISALVGILNYIKILPIVVNAIGRFFSKFNGLGLVESYSVVAYPFLNNGAVVSIKDHFEGMKKPQLFTVAMSSIASFTVTMVGAFMRMSEPRYVVATLFMNMIGTFIICNLVTGSRDESDIADEKIDDISSDDSFFEVLQEYMKIGFSIAVNVAVLVVGFVSLIALINNVFDATIGITFQDLMGYVLSPLAVLMGIPWSEAVTAGGIMATKVISNEFVAMSMLADLPAGLISERTFGIVSVFVMSFANIGTVAITAGVIGGLHAERGREVLRMTMPLLGASLLVSFLNAAIVAVVL